MNITPQELRTRLDGRHKLRLVDVREVDEWALARLSGAELIPLGEFQKRALDELSPGDQIVLYCHHGVRSARAQDFLKAHGYNDVLNLTGGIDAWSRQVDPSVARY